MCIQISQPFHIRIGIQHVNQPSFFWRTEKAFRPDRTRNQILVKSAALDLELEFKSLEVSRSSDSEPEEDAKD